MSETSFALGDHCFGCPCRVLIGNPPGRECAEHSAAYFLVLRTTALSFGDGRHTPSRGGTFIDSHPLQSIREYATLFSEVSQMVDERILTVEQAAELLQAGHETCRRWLKKGKLPGRKIFKQWRIVEVGLRRWITARQAELLSKSENAQ